MNAPPLPDAFPLGTLFALADGVPITESPDGVVLGWDCGSPRQMVAGEHRSWTALSELRFRTLVAANGGTG